MRRERNGILTLALAGAGLLGGAPAHAQEATAANPAHLHIGHVTDGFRDTPDGEGLLETAEGEASVVLQHAGLLADATDNLDMMKRHAGHVLHAIDPTLVDEGPGLGYGLLKAAQAVAAHITMAGEAPLATQNVKTHAGYVAMAARNTVERTERIRDLAEAIQDASDVEAAAELAGELDVLADQLLDGQDANDDGRVGAQEGEGGITQAETHMELMKQGEGLGT